MRKIYLILFSILFYSCISAQSPVPMAAQPGLAYTENFADIANWTNGFATGIGANRFGSVAVNATGTIPDGVRITTATASFVTGSSGGVQRGTQNIMLLSTGTTDNSTSDAIDFFMDFTGVGAGTLSFDWASVNNSTGDRKGSLRVYYSTDGTTFTELPAAQVLNFTNNVLTSGSVTAITLPAAFNNSATAQLRFYYYNGTGGAAGSRPKISIDNLTVTATGTAVNSVSVAAGNAAAEPLTNGSFTIDFSAPTSASTDINFDYTGGTATFGTDYTVSYSTGTTASTLATGTLTVPAGTSSVIVTITPSDDPAVEGTETVSLTLSAPSGGYILGTATASINLNDDDTAPTVSVAAGANAAEPATNGTFLITLSTASPAGGVIINYSLGGSAIAGSDYTDPQSGTITIPEGSSTGTITLNVIDDPAAEPAKTISITLNTASSPYIINTATATINLTSDDFAPISLVTTYSQDFNTLATTGTANSLTIPGWLMNETGGGARDNEQYAGDNGGSATGDTYSYGTTSSTDRALGSLQSGTLIPTFGSAYINNSGTTITRLRITYTGEQWRFGATGRNDRLDFQYSTDATNLTTGTWTDIDQLDFIAPTAPATGAVDGNATANRVDITFDITGLSIPDGAGFFIRWNDFNASGADDGTAIDDFSIEVNPADLTAPVVTSLSPANGATNVSLTADATITFNEPVQKVAGNILVRNASDNSIVQTIDVNSAAVSISSGTVSINLAALASNTGYYIEIAGGALEDQSGNDFAGISGNSTWAFTTGTDFYTAAFNNCTSALTDGFTQYSATGTVVWACTTFGRDPAAPAGTVAFPYGVQINGFSGGTNVPNVDWLISPSFDLTGTTYPLLSFWSRTAFNGLPLELKVSTDYTGGDPALATWTDINGKFPQQTSNTWTLSADINLSAFKQSNVHFAFVYTSTDDDGARWTLDDISVINSSIPPPPSLTVSTSDIQYTFVAAGATADKTFTFTGNDLTNNIALTSSGNFLLSKDGGSFSSSLFYTIAEANNITKTVFVRFAPPQANQNFAGLVTVNTEGLADTVTLKGTSIDPATTLEVVNWNLEWFGSPAMKPDNDNLQEQNIKTILQNVGADVYALVEVVDESRLANVVSQMPGYAYVVCDYGSHVNPNESNPGPLSEAQKEALVYKTSILSNVTSTPLLSLGVNTAADLSNPNYNYWSSGRYPFMVSADVTLNCVTKHIRFVIIHAKANTSPTNISYERRKNGADELYNLLSTSYPNDNIIILGDINDDLDNSITAGFTTTSWNIFTEDTVNFSAVTLPLSLAGKKSTVTYNDIIDHVIISNEMKPYYMAESANILNDVSSLVSNYGNTTTDHYPAFTRYIFPNTTAPVITSCPAGSSFCLNSSNTYTIPAFAATDDCDAVIYSYTITGATERTGTTNNASGLFNPGISTITWTATDSWGNASTCQTTVTINANPLVTIPDAFALSSGVLPNTVYIGYSPASSLTLTASANGGAPAYSYSWTNGSIAATATVSPVVNTSYTLTVTDANGCQGTATKSVVVKDVRGKNGKVIICHQSNNSTQEVAASAVSSHLSHGDMLGSCAGPQYPRFTASVSPNPSWNYFNVSLQGGNPAQTIRIRTLDLFGRVVETRNNLQTNQTVKLGSNYRTGIYFLDITQGDSRVILPLLKL